MDQSHVLVIAYIFPPIGGAGVQRVTKFVKFLPHFGWHASVLTVANPSVPLFDNSLLSDIPPQTIVRRAQTWEPSYSTKLAVASDAATGGRRRGIVNEIGIDFIRRVGTLLLQPDPQILWIPSAIQAGKRLLRERRHDAIIATAPPFSTFIVAAALSRHINLPLLLDYRDEWELTNTYFENRTPTGVGGWLQSHLQDRIVRAASAIIATTPSSAQALDRIRARVRSRAQVECIYNGYDLDDFPTEVLNRPPAAERFRLVYTGTLWNLTSAAPLVAAVQMLAQRSPSLAAQLELVFAGRKVGAQADVLKRLDGLPCQLVDLPYLPHSKAVELLVSAHVNCVLQTDLPDAGRILPAKIFEYLVVKRPILTIAPPGELWRLLQDHPLATCYKPADIDGIADYLAQRIATYQQHQPAPADAWNSMPFDRKQQAAQLARLLDSCLVSTRYVDQA